jgi:hypothetical protein
MFVFTSVKVAYPLKRKAKARHLLLAEVGGSIRSWLEGDRMFLNRSLILLVMIRSGSKFMAGTKNLREGKGTRFIVISLRSTLSEPSNRIEAVRLDKRWAIREFIRSKGVFSLAEGSSLEEGVCLDC